MGVNLQKKKSFSEINVTPFVDVVLVLLVIFIVTAPLLYNEIKIELPETKKIDKIPTNEELVVLSLSATGDLYLGKKKILDEELLKELSSELSKRKQKTVYIKGDKLLKYERLAKIMALLKTEGITGLSLVTTFE